ncbi:hypothetical protein HDU79_009136 [Rhizoclosmatium sp. JEL0117]|nr:hypothetical protein HDU79_009136 [Rhizoclosmatium sp. JEL0117]
MFTPSSTPEPVSTKSSKVRMIVSPDLLPHFKSKKSKAPLYSNLTSEQKARVAVIYAFALNNELFLTHFNVCGVIGHGTNGVVLGAKDLSTGQSVAIKIIYKTQVSTNEPFPSEIGVLKALNSHPLTSSTTLNFVTAWQDEHHFYLVTQFFGTNWMASVPESKLAPILFQSVLDGITTTHHFAFSTGSCDLWAWQNSMRRYQHLTEGTTLLPLQPIKHIIRSVASALWGIHQAGYYHGDIKLENVLVQYDAQLGDCTHPQVLLADYGHCDRVEAGISRYGTREVSPPEFLADSPFEADELDGQTADVFALGIVLYSLLSEIGSLPTVGDALQKGTIGYKYLVGADDGRYLFDEVGDVIDDEAWDLINQMCWVDPRRRIGLDQVLQHPWLN